MIILNPKAQWKQFTHPAGMQGNWYQWGDIRVCVARENGKWHVSVSHPSRYPNWHEIYLAWYDLVPDSENREGAIILPRKAEYVNIHPNCFHVHEL